MALPTTVGITTRTASQSSSNEIRAEASAASNNASIDSERCEKQVTIVRLKKPQWTSQLQWWRWWSWCVPNRLNLKPSSGSLWQKGWKIRTVFWGLLYWTLNPKPWTVKLYCTDHQEPQNNIGAYLRHLLERFRAWISGCAGALHQGSAVMSMLELLLKAFQAFPKIYLKLPSQNTLNPDPNPKLLNP